jgi:hypothetical protein
MPAGDGGDGGGAGATASDAAGRPGSSSPGGGAASEGDPGAGTTPDPDAIDHPTGATDIVLRVGEEGGFMMMEAVMARVPLFTLYGDGRVLIVRPVEGKVAPGGVPATEIGQARLTEDQVQAVLRNALTEGGLGIVKEEFPVMVMDAPTTVIELNAGGITKRVKVAALGMEPAPGPDASALVALATLVERLKAIPTDAVYTPSALVAVIAQTELAPGTTAEPWPWPNLEPAGFDQPAPDDMFGFSTHRLTTGEAAALGVVPGEPAAPRTVAGPDGRAWVLVVRPAMPEEAAAGS